MENNNKNNDLLYNNESYNNNNNPIFTDIYENKNCNKPELRDNLFLENENNKDPSNISENNKKSLNNANSNFENSPSEEYNKNVEQDISINSLSLINNRIKKNDSESLKTISINNEYSESNKNNDSLINNSLLNMNSINSINNNIKKYINNPNSNYDSFTENSNTNTLNKENEDNRSSYRPKENLLSKRNNDSSSLKSINYKYNENYYVDYIKYLLKDNYMNYAINQLKNIGINIKYYKLIYILKMLEQKVVKNMQQYAFFIVKGEGFTIKKNIFFSVLKTYIKNKNLYKNLNNDISILIKSNILYYTNIYKKHKYIPYIKPNDEKKLIQTQLFKNDINFNNLITFVCNYLKYEKKFSDFSPDLVKYYLMKRPLKNYNIFTITRYINSLNYIILFNKTNTKNILNKKRENNDLLTYNNLSNNYKLKSNNSQCYKENKKRSLSLDNNKFYNLKRLNTFYSLKKKIGGKNVLTKNNYTYDDIHELNLMKKKNKDNLINKEIVHQIYEDYNNNKKYMRRRSVNYEKANKMKMKRHFAKVSSCNVDNINFGNLKTPNNSLVKKSLKYMKPMKN